MSDNNRIYKTPIKNSTYLNWFVLTSIIGFLSFFLSVNLPVVGALLIILLLLLTNVVSEEIVVKEHCFEIYENRVFNISKRKKVYFYKEIEGVDLKKNKYRSGYSIPSIIIPSYKNGIIVFLKSGKQQSHDNIGVNYKNIAKAINIINKKLKV